MLYQKVIDELYQSFEGDIYSSSVHNSNEVYVEVKTSRIPDICKHICGSQGGTLVSLFANDERTINGKYAVYYVFAVRDQGSFIILKCGIEEENPTFPSITPDINQAHLYEREIRDCLVSFRKAIQIQDGLYSTATGLRACIL
jgi:hydrogenase-4 component G